MNRLTLLGVDDIEANRVSLHYLIEEYCNDINLILASSGEDALKKAYTNDIDLIVLDIQMPGLDGFDTAKYLKSNPKTKHIPIIFLTAAFKKDEFQQKGFEVGAIDYLTKPIEDLQFINKLNLYKEVIFKTKELEKMNEELNKSLKEAIEHKEIIQKQQKELEDKNRFLEELSVTDNLTKLYNRNKLDEVLSIEANRSNRFEHAFGVVIIDIDYFKSVNDLYGHQMGDTVLKEFADILKSNSRKTDTVGRWGGEEFLIICSETNLEGILSFAQSIREKISSFPFAIGEKKTASFGVSVYKKDENVESMIKRADDALYNAKENGRNRVEFL